MVGPQQWGLAPRSLAVSRASVELGSGEGGLDAPRARASRQGCGPPRIDWAIVAGSDSRSGAGVSGEATPRPGNGRHQVRATGPIKWMTRTARLRIEE